MAAVSTYIAGASLVASLGMNAESKTAAYKQNRALDDQQQTEAQAIEGQKKAAAKKRKQTIDNQRKQLMGGAGNSNYSINQTSEVGTADGITGAPLG